MIHVRNGSMPMTLAFLGLLSVTTGACGNLDGPQEWSSHELQLSVAFDTVPDGTVGGTLPLRVQYDTLRNVVGHPILYATVQATNLSDRPLAGTTEKSCHWAFTAYDDPDLASPPVWTEESLSRACTLVAVELNLAPGGSQVFPRHLLPFDTIVAGRGPVSTYYFSARLMGWREDGSWDWLTEPLPAGSVELVR